MRLIAAMCVMTMRRDGIARLITALLQSQHLIRRRWHGDVRCAITPLPVSHTRYLPYG